jgi:hypothetical protein
MQAHFEALKDYVEEKSVLEFNVRNIREDKPRSFLSGCNRFPSYSYKYQTEINVNMETKEHYKTIHSQISDLFLYRTYASISC